MLGNVLYLRGYHFKQQAALVLCLFFKYTKPILVWRILLINKS